MGIVHAATLAKLRRARLPFPDHEEPPAEPGGEHACEEWGVLGEVMPGGAYLRFWCPICCTEMFQVNSARGILHARKTARTHRPVCCAERVALGRKSIWPDEE